MLIAIPSKGRAGQITSLKTLPSAVLYVPVSECDNYAQAHPGAIIRGVPDNVKGITQTRNWILQDSNDKRVVMVDDDVKVCGWVKLYEESGAHYRLTEAEWLASWARLFDVTEDMKYRIFGIATTSELRAVYPYRPLIFHTYVTASCMGIVNDGRTLFDESFQVKEDYELCLRCIKEDGGIVGARYLYWENSHWTGEGGCVDYRTQSMEDDAIRRLIAMYPGMIRRVTRGGSQYSIDLEF